MDGGVPCGTPCKEEKCMQNFVMKAWSEEEATSKDLREGGWAIRRRPLKKKLYLGMCTAVVWLRTETCGGLV